MSKQDKFWEWYEKLCGEWIVFVAFGCGIIGLKALVLGIGIILAIQNQRFERMHERIADMEGKTKS